MKQIICIFLFLLLLTCHAQAQDVIFEDNFESYDSGTVPGAPWVTRFSGVSAANVVATIDVPASHQGSDRPETK